MVDPTGTQRDKCQCFLFPTFSGSAHLFMNLVIDMLPVLFLLLEDEEVVEEEV